MNRSERRLVIGFFGLTALVVLCSVTITGLLLATSTGLSGGLRRVADRGADIAAKVEVATSGTTSSPAGGTSVQQRAEASGGAAQPGKVLPGADVDLGANLSTLYDQVNPGVVSVVVTKSGPALFQGQPFQQQGSGSGWVYDGNHIVTNNHVTSDATDLEVVFFDGERRKGTVVGDDVFSDLAVIRVDDMPASARILPVLADFESLKVGQPVVAIGNPFERANSMTFGIISALGRTIPTELTRFAIPETIQTDAAINPGNSGGPLLDLRGQVIGVNAQINTTNVQGNVPGNSGVGFAIPSSIVRLVVPQLIKNGSYTWSFLGVTGGAVTTDLAKANNLPDTRGAFIQCVTSDGPSSGALEGADNVNCGTSGLTSGDVPVGGDVVLAIDGQEVQSFEDLLTYIALKTKPGQEVRLTVLRDGREQEVEVRLGEREVEAKTQQQQLTIP